MPAPLSDSMKNGLFAVLVIIGVVVILFIFHFIFGATWMIYVLVIAVFALMLVRKMVALKKQRKGTIPGNS
ncbi:MAG: hypothetical protein Q6373_012670 [Candidatus Sigynarchaeota archaeon]